MTNEKLYEVLGDINEKYVKEAKEYRKAKKLVWFKWGAIAACLCLAVAGAFAASVLQGEHGGVYPQLSNTPETGITQPEKDNEIMHSGGENLLFVNELESIMGADMDVQISHYNDLSTSERETILKEFETAIGLSYDEFETKISDTFVRRSFYSVDIPADAARTEYIPHDYVFEYQTENGGQVSLNQSKR